MQRLICLMLPLPFLRYPAILFTSLSASLRCDVVLMKAIVLNYPSERYSQSLKVVCDISYIYGAKTL